MSELRLRVQGNPSNVVEERNHHARQPGAADNGGDGGKWAMTNWMHFERLDHRGAGEIKKFLKIEAPEEANLDVFPLFVLPEPEISDYRIWAQAGASKNFLPLIKRIGFFEIKIVAREYRNEKLISSYFFLSDRFDWSFLLITKD
jgi:hypothetical protein